MPPTITAAPSHSRRKSARLRTEEPTIKRKQILDAHELLPLPLPLLIYSEEIALTHAEPMTMSAISKLVVSGPIAKQNKQMIIRDSHI